MLDQNLDADQNETDAAERLGDAAEPLSDEATEQNSERCHHKGCKSDGKRRRDDVHVEEGQGYADRHGIDTCADRRHQQETRGMAIWSLLFERTPHAIPDHFTANDSKQAERDPMIDGGDVDACSETGGPTDYRRDRLDGSEHKAGAEGFAEARAMKDRAFPERRGEGIGRHA